MKKIAIAFLLLLFAHNAFSSCYAVWSAAYDSAMIAYESNIERCKTAWSTARCLRETEAVLSSSLDSAADDFYNCIQ